MAAFFFLADLRGVSVDIAEAEVSDSFPPIDGDGEVVNLAFFTRDRVLLPTESREDVDRYPLSIVLDLLCRLGLTFESVAGPSSSRAFSSGKVMRGNAFVAFDGGLGGFFFDATPVPLVVLTADPPLSWVGVANDPDLNLALVLRPSDS